MGINLELFNRYSKSEVYLEEHNHVYVHKTTGNLYNSVTTALSLLKSEFEKENIIVAIQRQYTNFIQWYRKNNGREENLPELLFNYIMYGKKRPYTMYNDKKIYKALTKYSSPEELSIELESIKSLNLNTLLKGFYLNRDHTVMSQSQILEIWDATNLLSRHYGHMIHESLELNFLSIQGFPVDKMQKLISIQQKYKDLADLLSSIDKGFNKQFFSVYELHMPALEFMEWIIYKFNQIRPYKGEIIIPEKVNFSSRYEICGTTDVELVTNEIDFEIEDHKTNKEFTFVNEYNKFLKEPFDDIPETSFATYGLQLNIYGLIQEQEFGRRFNGARVTYFNRVNKEFELIELPVQLDVAEKVLQNFKNFQDTHKERFQISGIFDKIPAVHHNVLTKWLYEDIEKKKKMGTLNLEEKIKNREYFSKRVQEWSNKLSAAI